MPICIHTALSLLLLLLCSFVCDGGVAISYFEYASTMVRACVRVCACTFCTYAKTMESTNAMCICVLARHPATCECMRSNVYVNVLTLTL